MLIFHASIKTWQARLYVGIIIRISERVIRQYHHITMPSTKAQLTYRRAFNPRLQSATLWRLVLSIRSFFWWSYHPSLSVSLTQEEDVEDLVQSQVEDLLTTLWATRRSTWTCPPLMSFTGTILAINKPHYRRNRSHKISQLTPIQPLTKPATSMQVRTAL